MGKKTPHLIFLGVLISVICPLSYVSAQLVIPTTPWATLPALGKKLGDAAWIVFGVVVVICFVIAAILFLTAQGDATKLKTAKSAFIWGVAGVVIGIVAFTIKNIINLFLK